MKEFKRKAVRFFLGAELCLVFFYYLVSAYGLQALHSASQQNGHLLNEITLLETEIKELADELEERENNPFYKEMIARKELQMAYENEIVYVIDKKNLPKQNTESKDSVN